ncbi:hypothetical protein Z965_05160 [Clostridium novyi A str. BKT29909]|nr:hypothetical protein Z965_05160 [Clostridium novyi A str. BKT29909]
MPTSAGKTLLAKFYILQVLSLYSKAKIAYIVPTRALVNQVKRDLKKEFSRFDLKVEVAIPFMELDELEQEVLIKDSDIIVTTPEKLDLMVRTKNTFIDDLKLVIVDEAHTIQDPHRGAKLELLLAMLRKENRNLKFLMLSPFIENAKSIVKWLSNDRGLDILVDWKPSQQFTGISEIVEGKRGRHKEVVKYIPSSLNDMYYNEFSIKIGNITNKNISKIDRAVTLAQKYERIGGVLILCIRREYSESIMSLLLERNDISCEKLKQLTKLLDLIEEEMGKDSLLYKSVKKGCAYHHSAIPLVIREEIEEAISKQLITIVAATTTLAQGMNFPIATVIFQGMTMPENKSSRRMTVSEFWNIAGRAGRALVDKEGHIIAICKETKDVKSFKEYLSNKNQEVFSSLLKVIRSIPEECLKLTYLEQHNELSSFLQYIYHIVRLNSDIEVEDLLRGSLVYSNLQELGEMEQGEKLLRITNEYIKMISNDMKKKNLMSIIDKSGLSSISMHSLITKIRKVKKYRY